MSDAMAFNQLCSVFVGGLLDKGHAYDSGLLSAFQRSRLAESMTADIRKLGDMVFPAARTPLVSLAAAQIAGSMSHDLRQATWHSQKKLDGYATFTYEHLHPVRAIRTALAGARTESAAHRILDRMLWVAWITKEEDKRLRDLGYGSIRPHPLAAYAQAGIDLLPHVDGPTTGEEIGCMSCGQLPARWLVTGANTGNAPGRLLAYCDTCREVNAGFVAVTLPIGVLDHDPEAVLLTLYEAGATATDPQMVAEALRIPAGQWLQAAKSAISRAADRK